jgi:hypothetical protein
MLMTRLLLACALAIPLLAGCQDTDLGFKAVDGLEHLGGAFDSHRTTQAPDPALCPADKTAATCR